MTEPPAKPAPHLRPATTTDIEARRTREAAALRANLARRKQQQRARIAPPASDKPASDKSDTPCP